MKFGLDYLSAHLNRASYDLSQFEREAASPVFNRETGEINNCMIPKSQYRKDVHLNDVVIGSYAGGQFGFSPIVIREGLTVTRVDLKCDIYSWEGLEDGRTANQYGAYIYRLVRNYLLKKGRRVRTHDFTTISANPLEPKTYEVGARGSEWQLRIYTKGSDNAQLVRFEFQLRKELARSVWEIISPNVYDEQLLSTAFSSIEATILAPGLLQIDYNYKGEAIERETRIETSNREKWIRTQVKSAIIQHFKETGVDLSFILYQDVQKYFSTITEGNIAYDKVTKRLKAERLFMED